MTNSYLDERTARDIGQRIARIHRDLGYVDGKVSLTAARQLLRLDLRYYTSDDPALVGEVVHKLKVGAKQVIDRPTLLLEAVRKLDLRALFVPDRKQILIDTALPDLKKRWTEGHEVAHSLIPWHAHYLFGDNRSTLSLSCHERIEAEANYGAGRLLFPLRSFSDLRQSSPLTLARVREIAKHFGNTITSTLWRCVEAEERPSFGVVGGHPHGLRDGRPAVEHLIRSKAFEQRFSCFTATDAERLLRLYCTYGVSGPLGAGEIVIHDDDGAEHLFYAESFDVTHYVLTLAQYLRPKQVHVAVASASSAATVPLPARQPTRSTGPHPINRVKAFRVGQSPQGTGEVG